jgi:hypothetical protein
LATSPTSKSATTSGAAKDDTLGDDGHFTFTYDELVAKLLANDPGGAAKVDITKQFFFGDNATGNHNLQDQNNYLASHGITNDGHGNYTIGVDATDIDYFVQIGNKGTWSEAHVDVTAPPAPTGHAGDLLFNENFDHYSAIEDHGSWDVDNLGYGGWANTQGTGAISELLNTSALATSGTHSLDTQNTPGNLDVFNWYNDPTGGKAQLSFDIAKQDWGPASQTDPNAAFQFKVDGKVVAEIHASDLAQSNTMTHFDIVFDAGAGDAFGNHGIELVDMTPGDNHFTGFAVDSIQIHDWIV